MAADPRLGVSGMMSADPPNAKDLKLDDTLLRELKERNEFEAAEETQRRYAGLVSAFSVRRQINII